MKIEIKVPSNKYQLLSIVLAVALLIVGGMYLRSTGMFTYADPNVVGQKAIDFINTNVVRPGTSASLVRVEKFSGMYKVITSYNGHEIPVYITIDGKYMFLCLPVDITQTFQEAQKPEIAHQKFDAPDREKPVVKIFTMAFCPFGNIAEDGIYPVYKLLKDKVEWEPHYVISSNYCGWLVKCKCTQGTDENGRCKEDTRFREDPTQRQNYCLDYTKDIPLYCSMHGIQELHEDIRELCIWKYYPHDTFWDFVIQVNKKCNAHNADTCWESIAKELRIDTEKIKKCQKNEAISLLENEVKLNKQYKVTGSPTVFINDKEYNGDRSPEAYKEAICSGFIHKPPECSQSLESANKENSGVCS